jgi:hypothetical protein
MVVAIEDSYEVLQVEFFFFCGHQDIFLRVISKKYQNNPKIQKHHNPVGVGWMLHRTAPRSTLIIAR